VHVRVRPTPFRRLPDAPARPDGPAPDVLPYPAAAPAPTHPRWEGLDSYWYKLLVPLSTDRERRRVDMGAVIVVPALPDGDLGGERGA
jgi:hypothetical protein